jgi:hypothetical protein
LFVGNDGGARRNHLEVLPETAVLHDLLHANHLVGLDKDGVLIEGIYLVMEYLVTVSDVQVAEIRTDEVVVKREFTE